MSAEKIVNADSALVSLIYSAGTFDACVTDPPYGLSFMGKGWDYAVPGPDHWREILAVLKPGAHLLAFAGSRTAHRMTCAIEDAGFEIRDVIMWLYGTGFPKGKAQLKPAYEPVIVARKPIEGTLESNVEARGVGAFNIDACRIGGETITTIGSAKKGTSAYGDYAGMAAPKDHIGRWPANVAHDGSDEVMAAFPEAAGQQGVVTGDEPSPAGDGAVLGKRRRVASGVPREESATSAARFFYCAKASRADRGEGNNHPTVKPTELMRWLCRLVTPPGGLILDPFAGSGSTGKAARLEGFRFVGFELDERYCEIARARIAEAA